MQYTYYDHEQLKYLPLTLQPNKKYAPCTFKSLERKIIS